MHCFQFQKHNDFSFPPSFDEIILLQLFYKMHSISVLGKETKSWFYTEYLTYTKVLLLLLRAVNCSENACAKWHIQIILVGY